MAGIPRPIFDPPPDFSGRESDLAELHGAIQRGETRIGIFGMGGVGKTTLAQKLAKQLIERYPTRYPTQIYLPLGQRDITLPEHIEVTADYLPLGQRDITGVMDTRPLLPIEAMMLVIQVFEPNYRVSLAAQSGTREKEDTRSLQHQLNEARRNLRLIEERKAEYVEQITIPLQLIKEEKDLLNRIKKLEERLAPKFDAASSRTQFEILQGKYYSILRSQNVLLLADDVQDDSQVTPLIPPSHCLFLTTSRNHLQKIPGLHSHILHEFSKKDAKAFLLGIASRIGDKAEVIADRCGHLPLALRIAGSLLRTQLDLSPKDYAEDLREEKNRLAALGRGKDAVEATIKLSYDRLSDENTKRVFRQLAVFPGLFDKKAEASICIDPDNLHIHELFRQYSLVDWHKPDERYRLHDLIRIFATALWGESEDYARLQFTHAEYYEDVLRNTNTQYVRGGSSAQKALGLLGLEWDNIRAGQSCVAACVQTDGKDKDAARLCSGYAEGGKDCIAYRLLVREQALWHESGLIAARYVGNHAAEATHLGALGCIYAALGEPRKAINYHEEHLSLARANGDQAGEGDALGNLANAYIDLDQINKATELFQRQLALVSDLKDPCKTRIAMTNLAGACISSGAYGKALNILKEQLNLARKFMDIQGESIISMNLGFVHFELGNVSEASKFYRAACHLSHNIEDWCNEANAWWNMSLCAEKQGFRDRAIQYAKEALRLFIQVDDPHALEAQETLDVWGERQNKQV